MRGWLVRAVRRRSPRFFFLWTSDLGFGFHSHVNLGSGRESNLLAGRVLECIFDPNLAIKLLGTVDGDLDFLRLVRVHGLNNLFDHAGKLEDGFVVRRLVLVLFHIQLISGYSPSAGRAQVARHEEITCRGATRCETRMLFHEMQETLPGIMS